MSNNQYELELEKFCIIDWTVQCNEKNLQQENIDEIPFSVQIPKSKEHVDKLKQQYSLNQKNLLKQNIQTNTQIVQINNFDIDIQFGQYNQKEVLEQILGNNERSHQLQTNNYEQFITYFVGKDYCEYLLLIWMLINGWLLESESIKMLSCCIISRLLKTYMNYEHQTRYGSVGKNFNYDLNMVTRLLTNQKNQHVVDYLKKNQDIDKFIINYINTIFNLNIIKLLPLFSNNKPSEIDLIFKIIDDSQINRLWSNISNSSKTIQIFYSAIAYEFRNKLNQRSMVEPFETNELIIERNQPSGNNLEYQIFKDQQNFQIYSMLNLKTLTFFNLNPKDEPYQSPFIMAFEIIKNNDYLSSIKSLINRQYNRVPTCDDSGAYIFYIELLDLIFSNTNQFKFLFPFETANTVKLDFFDDKHIHIRNELQISFLKLKGRSTSLDLHTLTLWVQLYSLNQYYLNIDCSRTVTEISTVILKYYGNCINKPNHSRCGHIVMDSLMSLLYNLNYFKEKPDNNILSQIKECLIQSESIFQNQISYTTSNPQENTNQHPSQHLTNTEPDKDPPLSPIHKNTLDDDDLNRLEHLICSEVSKNSNQLMQSAVVKQSSNQLSQIRLLFNNPLFLLISCHGPLIKADKVGKMLEILAEDCMNGNENQNLSFNSVQTDPLFGQDTKSVYSNMTSRQNNIPKISILNHRRFKKFTIPNQIINHHVLINGQQQERYLWKFALNTLNENIDESMEKTGSEFSSYLNKETKELLRYHPIDKMAIKNIRFSKQISLDYQLHSNINTNKIRLLSSGQKFVVIVTQNNFIYSMGDNTYGQLGIGQNINNTINQVSDQQKNKVFTAVYSMTKIEMNIGYCKFIKCGYEHVIYININDDIQTWGNNQQDCNIHTSHKEFIINSPKLIKFNPSSIYLDLYKQQSFYQSIKTEYNSKIVKISALSCGAYHQFITINDRILFCWGMADRMQLPLDDAFLSEYCEDGYIFKQAGTPQLVDYFTPSKIDDIQCGETHNILLTDNSIYTCGTNDIGQCGLGLDTQQASKFTLLNQLVNNVDKFSTGGSHTLVITLDKRLVGFGNNIHMQAGIAGPGCEILHEPTEVDAISSPMVPVRVFCGPKASVVQTALQDFIEEVGMKVEGGDKDKDKGKGQEKGKGNEKQTGKDSKVDQMTWAFGANQGGCLGPSSKENLSPTIIQQLQGMDLKFVEINQDMVIMIKND